MIQVKLEVVYFEMQKFFTPLESFLPPFCHDEILEYWRSSKSSFEHSNAKKGGKKLLHGVKNLFISKSEMSSFSWIKNDAFIWKIHSCTLLQSLSTSRVGYRVSPLKGGPGFFRKFFFLPKKTNFYFAFTWIDFSEF